MCKPSNSHFISAIRDPTVNSARVHPDKIDDGSGNYFGLDPANDVAARDDIVVGSLVVPVNQPIALTLHSKDVVHSFYVRELRLQQDFVPGLDIPVHFTATQTGKFEIVCTQLCGLGHYNMRAYLQVMTASDYDRLAKSPGGPIDAIDWAHAELKNSSARSRGSHMPDASAHPAAAHQHTAPTGFIRKHIFSLDHKVIGKQYYGLALVAVFVGMILSWLMRIHLAYPNWPIPLLGKLSAVGAPGGVMTPEYYLSLLTMHGTLMVFFVLTNAPFAAFGNYFLPIQIGAEDMAFPRFNMMSFWTTFVAFVVMMAAFFVSDGPPISGWTAYAPLSAVGKDAGPGLAMGQNLWAISIAIFCVASLLGALNFIATTLDLRTKGMTLARMPYSSWAWFVTSVIALLAFAVLLPACILLILDRVAGTSFFIPAGLVLSDRLQPHSGGSPLLWQHLFWFFGHPEVYIAILPSIGIVAHILPRIRAETGARAARLDRQHDRHRLPELHGLGPSHVCQRHESIFG